MSTQDNIPQIQLIPIESIEPSPMNPRKTFSEDALRELSESISEQGLLQPITVRPSDYEGHVEDDQLISIPIKYEIVCGERRYRACKMVGMATIPCIVRNMSDDEAFDAMITENLQRNDVDPIEEAEAFRILQQRGQTVEELSLRFGKSEKYVRDRMRLVALIDTLQKALSIGQIPMKGAYLLSRLSEEDQQEFFEDQLDASHETNVTADDVEKWLDRHFRNLYGAPFQEKGRLRETWNPDGKLIRRCDTCECNTRNHGCLFADMQKDEPQCIDETCYNRKIDIYNEWFISQYADRIVREGEPAAAGRMHIVAEEPYGDDAQKRYNALTESLRQKGYRLFTDKQLSSYYGTPDELLKKGELVEGINLRDLSTGYTVKIRYFRINSVRGGLPAGSASDTSFLVSRLAERAASIETTKLRKIIKYAKGHYDREAYVKRQHILSEWEENIILAILFDQMEWNDRSETLPGCSCGLTTYKQAVSLSKSPAGVKAMLKRKAIAAYCAKEMNKDFFIALATRLSVEVEDFANRTRQETDTRIQSIHDELRELGYDENGNKL